MADVLLTPISVVNGFHRVAKEIEMFTFHRFFMLSVCLASGAAGMPSLSLADSQIINDVAPPAPRVEIAPPVRDGFVWSPGFWAWSGHSYYWTPGSSEVQRRGAHYVPNQWQQTGTQWLFVRGHWER
jgi:hypothetical protein